MLAQWPQYEKLNPMSWNLDWLWACHGLVSAIFRRRSMYAQDAHRTSLIYILLHLIIKMPMMIIIWWWSSMFEKILLAFQWFESPIYHSGSGGPDDHQYGLLLVMSINIWVMIIRIWVMSRKCSVIIIPMNWRTNEMYFAPII